MQTDRQNKDTHWNVEVNSIVSVDFLGSPPYGWVLNELVALPLQTESTMFVCPTVWIHAISDK